MLGAATHVSTSLKTPGVTSVLTSSHAKPSQQSSAPEQSFPTVTHGVGGGGGGDATSGGGGGGGGEATVAVGGGEGEGGGGVGGMGGGAGGCGERLGMMLGGDGGGPGRGGGRGLRTSTAAEPAKAIPARSPTSPLGMSSHASHARRPIASSTMSRRHPRLAQPNVVLAVAARSSASLSASLSASSGTATTTGTSVAPVDTG